MTAPERIFQRTWLLLDRHDAATLERLDRLLGDWADAFEVLVEDQQALQRAASLPFTREIGATTGLLRGLDAVVLERALVREQARLRRALELIAGRRGTTWQLRSQPSAAAPTKEFGETDLLVLDTRRSAAFPSRLRRSYGAMLEAPCPVLVLQYPGDPREVAVLTGYSERDEKAIELASRIARHAGLPLRLITARNLPRLSLSSLLVVSRKDPRLDLRNRLPETQAVLLTP